MTHGLFAYEGTLHVPVVIYQPRLFRSVVGVAPVRHVDILPTVLDAISAPLRTAVDGRSLRALAAGGAAATAATYFESLSASINRGWPRWYGVSRGSLRYIDLPIPELYDLAVDATESHDLAPSRPGDVRELQRLLAALRAEDRPAVPARENADTREQLRSLGYLAGTAAAKTHYTEADDPKRLIEIDREIDDVVSRYQRGDLRGAIALGERVVQQRPDMPLSLVHLAFLYNEAGAHVRAVAAIRRALDLNPAAQDVAARAGARSARLPDALQSRRSPHSARSSIRSATVLGAVPRDSAARTRSVRSRTCSEMVNIQSTVDPSQIVRKATARALDRLVHRVLNGSIASPARCGSTLYKGVPVMKRVLCLTVALLAALAPGASAQFTGGNIYGTAVDQQGGVLPGVDVTLVATSIGGQPRTTVTDTQGQFRFLNLDPGTYKVTTSLNGFNKMERDIIVTTGVNTNISFPMTVRSVEETVTVTPQTPVVDVKKMGTLTTITQEELQSTPQSKDPWAMLKTVPGVIVDRVNVGGNESGQQSGFVGKRALFSDTMWNLDGVVITDTTSGGASSSYFDFDAFDQVAINTGGNDLKVQTGGLGINFVTRRGTNLFKGSARYDISDTNLESSNLPDELKNDSRLGGADKANHTDRITNRGFDIGGPIMKDKLWFWASYGKQDIKIVKLNQTTDETFLKNTNAKVNWAATRKDEVSFFYFNGAKEKLGRSPGTTGNEDDSFLWNQGNFYPLDEFLHPLHSLW